MLRVSVPAIQLVGGIAPGSGGDRALVEEELPAVVAEDPDGGVVGDGGCGGDVVGREGRVVRQRGDVEVAHGGGAGVAGVEGLGELLDVEDFAGGAELLEFRGQKGIEGVAVGLAIRVEEPLFEAVKMGL